MEFVADARRIDRCTSTILVANGDDRVLAYIAATPDPTPVIGLVGVFPESRNDTDVRLGLGNAEVVQAPTCAKRSASVLVTMRLRVEHGAAVLAWHHAFVRLVLGVVFLEMAVRTEKRESLRMRLDFGGRRATAWAVQGLLALVEMVKLKRAHASIVSAAGALATPLLAQFRTQFDVRHISNWWDVQYNTIAA